MFGKALCKGAVPIAPLENQSDKPRSLKRISDDNLLPDVYLMFIAINNGL